MFFCPDNETLLRMKREREEREAEQVAREQARIEAARNSMSAEQFKEWEAEERVERRHRELCQAIRDAAWITRGVAS